jgi:hypothetical protein
MFVCALAASARLVCVCVFFFFCVGGFMSCGLLKRVAERNDIVWVSDFGISFFWRELD